MLALATLSRRRTINFWLSCLVVACILPAAAVAAFLIDRAYQEERASIATGTIATARALMQAVDADLIGAQSTLEVLATSPYLASGDLSSFYDQARQALGNRSGNNIVLTDSAGQQRVNTLRPFGEPLPRHGNPEQLQRVLSTGRPVVSDLFIGGVTRQPLIVVEVPVLSHGTAVAGLAMGFLPERLGEVLRRQHIPPDVVAAIFDSTGTIVARTHAPEQFVGRTGAAALVHRIAEVPEGVVETVTLEGIAVLSAFSRSTLSGWSVAIGIPTAALTGDLRRSLLVDATAALAVLLLGALLARIIGARIGRSIRALTAPAMALGTPEPIAIPASPIAEVNELGQALIKASELIEQRARERDTAAMAERQMMAEKHAAEEADRAKSEFLALMSHELRTPMNGILGFAQLLESDRFGALTAKQKEFAAHILASGNHLLQLIDDTLDLSKIEVGKLSVSIERVDLVPLMKSVAATLAQPADKAGAELIVGDFGLGMPNVKADRVRLAQALLNLGSNAIKYNRPNGTVTFSYERLGDGRVRLRVSDTGMGIPENRQAELFQPFSRLGAEHRAIEGTGIGLALTRRLVGLMGGEVGFSSAENLGSSFWIDIPAYAASPQADQAAGEATAPDLRHSAGFSVVYVEDNPSNLVLVRNILATLPRVQLREAPDGATGLAMARQHRPDLIILDVNLPDLNGFALLQELRRLPELAATPVLALSANAMPRDVKRGIEAGFFRYLTKPLDVNKFLEAIEAALSAGKRRAVEAGTGASRPTQESA